MLVGRRAGPLRGVAAGGLMALAFAVTIAPWTAIASNDLGRFVPVSTGGGKALFIGTYLPGDGLHQGTKQHLQHRFRGTDPSPEELRLLPMNPLLDEVAEEYPRCRATRRSDASGARTSSTGRPTSRARSRR